LARQPSREMLKRRKINRESSHGRAADDDYRADRITGSKMTELRERRRGIRIGYRL